MEQNLYAQLSSLLVYRGLLQLKPVSALQTLLKNLEAGEAKVDDYANVFYALTAEGCDSLAEYLYEHVRYDESPFAEAAARDRVTGVMERAARHDIQVLQNVSNLRCKELKGELAAQQPSSWRTLVEELPEWQAGSAAEVPLDGGEATPRKCRLTANVGAAFSYEELLRFYQVNGSGTFARYQAFVWQEGQLYPVPHPDFLPQGSMWGYQRQRDQVIENTRALMSGKAVNNVLLYGASGTGKSATVKAMLGMPEFEGLRLIEVQKEELTDIPHLVRTLGHRPQKFIIFIDDLAFDKADKTFSSLKTILEGGLEPRPTNVAVYCTSNRRHLVRQNFSDRSGDEVDANETIQDKTSLAERFGLRILFSELNKAQFIQMAEDLAHAQGLAVDHETIQAEAVKWDIRHPSRSPRSANQFVASMMAKYC
ncbi:MAG: ATP-binding protein [Clostridiales bacterium]|nr:ATP-binding protein [Clostridiales bacterium]